MTVQEDHPLSRDLPSLGHEAALWLRGMRMLRLRVEKNRLPASLSAFLQRWLPGGELPEELPEHFELMLENGRLCAGPVAAFADSRWHALLRLPGLRSFWVGELRASHHAHLLKMTRPVWLMDETPLPPGAVIAGLGIPSWAHLPRLAQQGRIFTEETLENGCRVLLEAAATGHTRVLAEYAQRGGKIMLMGAREVGV